MNFILGSQGSGGINTKREVLWKPKDGESIILDVDLSPLGQNLKFLSSSTRDVAHMESLEEQYGDRWVEHYV
jgi:type IV secretory pathway VirB4 component